LTSRGDWIESQGLRTIGVQVAVLVKTHEINDKNVDYGSIPASSLVGTEGLNFDAYKTKEKVLTSMREVFSPHTFTSGPFIDSDWGLLSLGVAAADVPIWFYAARIVGRDGSRKICQANML
jgi:hypothetical protein